MPAKCFYKVSFTKCAALCVVISIFKVKNMVDDSCLGLEGLILT